MDNEDDPKVQGTALCQPEFLSSVFLNIGISNNLLVRRHTESPETQVQQT